MRFDVYRQVSPVLSSELSSIKRRKPTSGLEPLTPAHYELACGYPGAYHHVSVRAPLKPTVMDEIAYSVERFIPIDMGFEGNFEPHQPWSKAYDAIHVVAGWLLIPLFLVSWSGLVRSRR